MFIASLFLKIPHKVTEVMVVLMVGTTMRVVFIVLEVEVMTYCTAPLTFLLLAGRRLEPNFLRWVGLTGTQFLEGICWQGGGDLSQEGLQFLRKK